jgi:hypothetical protein
MELSFYFLVFQANPDREKVYYWKDGVKTKQVIDKSKFIDLALSMGKSNLYSQVIDACNTYSFYLWDYMDNKIIHLSQKIEKEDNFKYKNTLVHEFNSFKKNPEYSSQESLKHSKDKRNNNSPFQVLSDLGFEKPSFDQIPLLVQSMERKEEGSFLDKVKGIFKK